VKSEFGSISNVRCCLPPVGIRLLSGNLSDMECNCGLPHCRLDASALDGDRRSHRFIVAGCDLYKPPLPGGVRVCLRKGCNHPAHVTDGAEYDFCEITNADGRSCLHKAAHDGKASLPADHPDIIASAESKRGRRAMQKWRRSFKFTPVEAGSAPPTCPNGGQRVMNRTLLPGAGAASLAPHSSQADAVWDESFRHPLQDHAFAHEHPYHVDE